MSGFVWQWGGPDRYPHTAPAPSATVLRASCHRVVVEQVRVHCFSKVDVAAIYFVSQRFLALSCLPACLSSVFSRIDVALIYFVSQSKSNNKCRTTRWAHKSLLNSFVGRADDRKRRCKQLLAHVVSRGEATVEIENDRFGHWPLALDFRKLVAGWQFKRKEQTD